MIKQFLFLLQIIFILIVFFIIFRFDQRLDFYWKGIIFTINTRYIFIIILFLILITLFFQRIYLYIRHSPKRIKNNLLLNKYEKGISAIVRALAALSNNDGRELAIQSRKIDNYLKNNPINLILKAEAAKKDKKFNIAEENYNKMLLNPDTKILGLRGLLEQNLKLQDYHHALIYAEQIYNINSKLDWIYKTIFQILVITKNWQKIIQINNDAQRKKIISKQELQKSNALACYEIALIKQDSSIKESLDLLENANQLRPNFPPIIKKYLALLIDYNEISKAKKILFKTWLAEPHQMYFDEIKKISEKDNLSIVKMVQKLTRNNSQKYESIILQVKSNIIEKNLEKAKELIKPKLSTKPNKTICKLMYEIEYGLSGNMQKANSWNSRALLGDLEKAWVCRHSGVVEDEWVSVNQKGFFDSLEWTWPKNDLNQKLKGVDNLIPEII